MNLYVVFRRFNTDLINNPVCFVMFATGTICDQQQRTFRARNVGCPDFSWHATVSFVVGLPFQSSRPSTVNITVAG